MRIEYPRIHFYDHDLIDMYDQTWIWIRNSWKEGTEQNGLRPRYFGCLDSKKINQFESILSALFLSYANRNTHVLSVLDNFYDKQEESGAIRGEYSENTGKPILRKPNSEGIMPPLFSWAEYNIYHRVGIKRRVRDVMPRLIAYYEWVERTFKQENGLYAVPLEAVCMDNSPRDGAYYPVDFNCQMALNALYMSELGDILNDKDVSYRFKRGYFSLKTRISSLMWNDRDGYYYDLDRREKQVRVRTIASFWPLLAQIPNEEKSERLIGHLNDPEHFGLENPFPTLAACEKEFSEEGMGFRGSVYPAFTYMVIKGLERYGKYELAREFALRHLYFVLDGLHPENGRRGTLWEAYLPMREGPARWPGVRKFPRSKYLPGGALATVTMMIENVVGLNISLPRKTVEWTISTRELMGIENLALRRNTVSILCDRSHRGWEIGLESEKLYYLTVHVVGEKRKTLPIPSGKCSILIDKI